MHLFSVTSQGYIFDYLGEWIDDKLLKFNWKGCRDNEDLEQKIMVNWQVKTRLK